MHLDISYASGGRGHGEPLGLLLVDASMEITSFQEQIYGKRVQIPPAGMDVSSMFEEIPTR
jgi:hypothetical protein